MLAWRGLVPRANVNGAFRTGGVFWLGPGAHIVHYPVRGGELFNFIGMVDRDDWRSDRWNERGTIDECAGDFPGPHDDVHEMIRNIEMPFKWALIVREPLAGWSVGRVTLLGDAAHSTLPLLAQGANMAIEDGFVLARCLEQFAGDLDLALRAYEASRLPRTTKVVRISAAQVKRVHSDALSDAEAAEAYIAQEFTEERVRERYDWLYEYDAVAGPLPVPTSLMESAADQ